MYCHPCQTFLKLMNNPIISSSDVLQSFLTTLNFIILQGYGQLKKKSLAVSNSIIVSLDSRPKQCHNVLKLMEDPIINSSNVLQRFLTLVNLGVFVNKVMRVISDTICDPLTITDKNVVDKSYQLVTQFLDFPLWENRIAYFK